MTDEKNTMTSSISQALRTPAFCGVCGSRLAPSNDIQGYDPFTGFPVASEKLHCTNPTIEVSGGLLNKKTQHTYHPSWVLEGNRWTQL